MAATSVRRSARIARTTLIGSAPSLLLFTLARRRMPAVSTRVSGVPSGSATSLSTASCVVPERSDTIARCVPVMAFTSEDLPTLGRPMIATASGASRVVASSRCGGGSACAARELGFCVNAPTSCESGVS